MREFIDRTGETRVMNCGMKATIIAYRGAEDIDVKFEDEYIARNKCYNSFIRGAIQNKNIGNKKLDENGNIVIRNRKNRVGETLLMQCGMEATIIAYRSVFDIDVEFKDGTIVRNKLYSCFKKLGIQNPNLRLSTFIDRTGETRMMKCGQKATIIAYRGALDIDIQFEDKTIVKNRAYRDFAEMSIRNPNIDKNRLGETQTMNCGQKATIIAYRGVADIDVQFEDGYIARNKRYNNFIRGSIQNPNLRLSTFIDRTGETRMMKCGMQATIVAYRDKKGVDVQFEDGTIVENKTYKNFKEGSIQNPNLCKSRSNSRIGETRLMNCGMRATIIAYRSTLDIDIQFEDGTIVKNRKYEHFSKGHIAYPNKSLNSIEIGQQVYRMKNKVYYNCACQKCHANMILTPQEMLQHHC